MIIVRAPLRISFVGGGTDLPDFYRAYPGRVISAAINKYVYVMINPTPMINNVTARYGAIETVSHARELKNNRMREALLDLGIHNNIDISTMSQMWVGSGLGSSSSFSVALIKGLNAYLGKKIDNEEAAEAASRLEIELLGEPIGKQDQYAAAFGGFNVFQFNQNGSVDVDPVLLDYKKRLDLERHLLLFFIGITREASGVLKEQKENIQKKFEILKEMADSVFVFKETLMKGNFQNLGELLHDGWLRKKTLASNVSNDIIDSFYEAGMGGGAWGGKILGAGGGGCLLFLAPIEKKEEIRKKLNAIAKQNNLPDFKEIPFQFVQSGVEILLSGDQPGQFRGNLV